MTRKRLERSVRKYEGKRKVDSTTYYGLWFEGDYHKAFFLTPAQYRTVLALRPQAEKILRDLPRSERRKENEE